MHNAKINKPLTMAKIHLRVTRTLFLFDICSNVMLVTIDAFPQDWTLYARYITMFLISLQIHVVRFTNVTVKEYEFNRWRLECKPAEIIATMRKGWDISLNNNVLIIIFLLHFWVMWKLVLFINIYFFMNSVLIRELNKYQKPHWCLKS